MKPIGRSDNKTHEKIQKGFENRSQRCRIVAIASDCKSLVLKGFVGSSPTTSTKIKKKSDLKAT